VLWPPRFVAALDQATVVQGDAVHMRLYHVCAVLSLHMHMHTLSCWSAALFCTSACALLGMHAVCCSTVWLISSSKEP
jgi:hypothetical protein